MKRLIPIATLLFLAGCQTNSTKPQNNDVSVKHAATYVQCLESDMASAASAEEFIAGITAEMNIIAKSNLDLEIVEQGVLQALKQGFSASRRSLENATNNLNNSAVARKHDFTLSGIGGCESEWRAEYLRLSTDSSVEIPPEIASRLQAVKNQDEYIAVIVDFIEYRMKQDGTYDENGEKTVAVLTELLPVFMSEFSQPIMNFAMSVGNIMQTSDNAKIKRMRTELESKLK